MSKVRLISVFIVITSISALFLLSSCSEDTEPKVMKQWEEMFDEAGRDACLYLKYPESGKVLTANPERVSRAFVPGETFKLLNSLIMLETGAVESLDDTLYWNEAIHPSYARDLKTTGREAFDDSTDWFFEDAARKVGADEMERIVTSIDCYGNMSRLGNVDDFWKDGSLTISAEGQGKFLELFSKNELPFEKEIIDTVSELAEEEEYPAGKLISVDAEVVNRPDGENIVWYMGIAEYQKRKAVFVMNMALPGDTLNPSILEEGKKITKDILKSQALYKK